MTADTADRDDLAAVAALPLGLAAPFLVYIAGASKGIARAERVIRLLRESGVGVTFDWCAHMRALEGVPLTREAAVSSALTDLDAVKRARVVVLLEPGYEWARAAPARVQTTGAWGELTLAVGVGVPVIVARPTLEEQIAHGVTLPPEWQTCIFTALASLVCADDDAAIRAVLHMAVTGVLPGGAS